MTPYSPCSLWFKTDTIDWWRAAWPDTAQTGLTIKPLLRVTKWWLQYRSECRRQFGWFLRVCWFFLHVKYWRMQSEHLGWANMLAKHVSVLSNMQQTIIFHNNFLSCNWCQIKEEGKSKSQLFRFFGTRQFWSFTVRQFSAALLFCSELR